MRRANVDIAYSQGFSPHQKMSFASPLSVGVTSRGEYFDIEVNSSESSEEMIRRINMANAPGVEVLSYKLLPDDAKNAMSIIAAADYLVHTDLFTENMIENFISQDNINVIKKTKKSEKEVDIKPFIYDIHLCGNGIFMKIAQGSSANLKPQLVISALAEYSNIILPEYILYERLDMYYLHEERLISLENIGGNIE